MNQYSIKLFEQQTNTLIDHPIPLDDNNTQCELRLRSLPGSSALYLLFFKDGQSELCLEAQVEDKQGEIVDVFVSLDTTTESFQLAVSVPNHQIFTLPKNTHYSPTVILPPAEEQTFLDIALLIDGTMRQFSNTQVDSSKEVKVPWYSRLLLQNKQWQDDVEKMSQFIDALHQHYQDCRINIIAFADDKLPNASARDLSPLYTVSPSNPQDRRFQDYKPERLKTALTRLEASSGGDIVDALAEGLEACSQLSWRSKARKLLILWGDSPGYCVFEPAPANLDIHVRGIDIDTAAAEIHHQGVEILTVYHQPPPELYDYYDDKKETGDSRHVLDYLSYTEKQYAHLASLPEMALRSNQFAAEEVAKLFCQRTVPIARMAAFGEKIIF